VESGRNGGVVAGHVSELAQYADERSELEIYCYWYVLSKAGKEPPRCETSLSVWKKPRNSNNEALDVPEGYKTFRICVSVRQCKDLK
jgi:hypothetical protein